MGPGVGAARSRAFFAVGPAGITCAPNGTRHTTSYQTATQHNRAQHPNTTTPPRNTPLHTLHNATPHHPDRTG